jgi:proto-oncogene tyrosine-protein kinase Ret
MERTTTPATPRDILSFAWQISKGMAYLSDIKVSTTVHSYYKHICKNQILTTCQKVLLVSKTDLNENPIFFF